ncbi:MAG TPA: hypothetical protein VE992_02095, partial [Solirubrobacteraceae bacterium]|nr:hypothetical protein [Solirubrobacteraceae bacterium]
MALRGGPAAAAALCLAGAALVVVLGTRLSFFNDDWYFLFQRPGLESHGGLDTLLAPHNGNLVVLVAAAFKVIVAVFGIHSQLPFRLLVGACVAGLGAAVYMLARPRVGELLALLAVALVVFLGPAWEALLFITGANHTAALAFGLGALAALERDTPRRNLAACLLLVCAIAVANTGLALVAGAAIAIALRRRPRQAWIPGVPAALFVLWWALEGHRQSTGVTGGHVVRIPIYAVQALSSGLASLSGADHASLPSVLRSGHLQLAVLAVAVAVWLWRGGRPRPQALVFAGALVAFWVLAGASAIPGRGATASRYQITDVALMVVLAAELLHGVRPPRAVIGAVAVAALAMVASNLLVMRQGFRFLRQDAAYARADLGAIELAGPRAPATVWLVPPIGGDPY